MLDVVHQRWEVRHKFHAIHFHDDDNKIGSRLLEEHPTVV